MPGLIIRWDFPERMTSSLLAMMYIICMAYIIHTQYHTQEKDQKKPQSYPPLLTPAP